MGCFLILGNEERQKQLFRILCSKGQTVTFCESWLEGNYDAVLLPAAQTAKYFEQIADKLQAGQYVFGCNFPQELMARKKREGIFFVDYMKEEGAAYINAVATAEGALAEAILAGKEVLAGKEMLVLGYGRCGQVLAGRLAALGGIVTVYEKDQERVAQAVANNLRAVPARAEYGADFWGRFTYFFNTVPAPVLDEKKLSKVRRSAVIIDIASAPGGVDKRYCERRNLNAKLCGGLPAKYAPVSAAGLLVSVIESNLKEVLSYDAG